MAPYQPYQEGFQKLLNWINTLKKLHKLEKAIVGMEPTGHYWIHLSKWLIMQDIEVVTVTYKCNSLVSN
jgi:transposase